MAITSTEKISYWDYAVDGSIDINNDLVYYENEDAVANAMSSWLKTEPGEVINQPTAGGSLTNMVFKNMDMFNQRKILFKLRSNIANYFSPSVQIVSLNIVPKGDIREWYIELKYIIKTFQAIKETRVPLQRVQLKSIFATQTEEIGYTGETLLNFVRIQLWDYRGKSLKYNGTYWSWADFVFINLTEDDDYFSQIQDLINSNRD